MRFHNSIVDLTRNFYVIFIFKAKTPTISYEAFYGLIRYIRRRRSLR